MSNQITKHNKICGRIKYGNAKERRNIQTVASNKILFFCCGKEGLCLVNLD